MRSRTSIEFGLLGVSIWAETRLGMKIPVSVIIEMTSAEVSGDVMGSKIYAVEQTSVAGLRERESG